MTHEHLYDLACERYADPAVFKMGKRWILGYWLARSKVEPDQKLRLTGKVPRAGSALEEMVVVQVAEADTLVELAVLAGFPLITATGGES